MKKFIIGFLRRGALASGIGPIILAFLYLILWQTSSLDSLTTKQVCVGIFSITLLAFIAGGMNAIYQVERLPLMVSIFIHSIVLYMSYLVTYLVNDWLDFGIVPFIVFTIIFVVGFIAIWAIIYSIIKRKTKTL